MSNIKYTYSFPENKAFKIGLFNEDYSVIAVNAGYKEGTVRDMLNGRRKLAETVKTECLRIAEINSNKLLNTAI